MQHREQPKELGTAIGILIIFLVPILYALYCGASR
jgi:hypothetical protein